MNSVDDGPIANDLFVHTIHEMYMYQNPIKYL